MFVMTYRPEFHGALHRQSGLSLTLQPLYRTLAARMVGQLLGNDPSMARLAERIAAAASGNPFFIEEIVRDLSGRGALSGSRGRYRLIGDVDDIAVPATVQAVLAARIDRLPAETKSILNASAVIGTHFDVDTLHALLPEAAFAALAELVSARLATEVTVAAWHGGLYPDNAAYLTSSEPGARAFLDAIEAMGFDAVARRFRDACRGLPYRHSGTGALLERRRRALPRSPLFYQHPVHLVRGEGVWLFDPDDRRYLDCYNNVPVVGHGHPRVVRAVAEQQRLLATHSRYLHEAIVELAERLKATLPPALDAVLVVNSGSEANDLAWRIARAATGRAGAVVSAYAYHGLTEATHALSPEEWAKGELPAHVATVPAPDGYRGPHRREEDGWAERYAAHIDDAARALGGHGFAAIYIDPAFTADGILVPPPAYLAEAARRARALGGVLIADEVQAGHGRYGTGLWSFQPSGIEPDMVVMGKPMGNGFPVAALVVRSQLLAAVPEEVELFSTFGGNPVACAAALAVLAVIEDEGLVANAAETGSYLRQGLETLAGRHPVVGDIRGEGLLLGVELADEERVPAAGRAGRVTEAMRERGILISTTGPAGNVLKIRPPLVFQREHADLLLQTLDEVLATVG